MSKKERINILIDAMTIIKEKFNNRIGWYICLAFYRYISETYNIPYNDVADNVSIEYPEFYEWISKIGRESHPNYKYGESWNVPYFEYTNESYEFKINHINVFIKELQNILDKE